MILSATERLDIVSGSNILGQIAFVVFGAVFLFGGLGFIWLIVASHISLLPPIGVAIWAIRRYRLAALPLQIDLRAWSRLIRAGLPFGVISLALTIAFSIDTVMLSWTAPEQEVGWYNVAYGLARSLLFFFGGFSVAIVPSLSRAFAHDGTAVERWYHRSVKFIVLSSLPIAVGGMLLAFPIIGFLYTPEFLPSALALQILIWDVPLLMFTGFCGNMTTITGDERQAARIYTINAIANIGLNLYAIPRFGLIGAALVTVVTDLIGALQFHFLLRRRLRLPNIGPLLVRASIAAGLMGLAVAALSHLHLFLTIGLGVAIYAVLALALRVLSDDERALIAGLLRRRFGPRPATKEPVA
jgi:O-antigen/teichoic acid export membrane protein